MNRLNLPIRFNGICNHLPEQVRPISILLGAYLLEHYKIETGSGAGKVMVDLGAALLRKDILAIR